MDFLISESNMSPYCLSGSDFVPVIRELTSCLYDPSLLKLHWFGFKITGRYEKLRVKLKALYIIVKC